MREERRRTTVFDSMRRRILEMLPVRGLETLLPSLARLWQDVGSCRRAYVSAWVPEESRIVGSAGGPVESVTVAPGVETTGGWWAGHVLAAVNGPLPRAAGAVEIVSFEEGDSTVGCAILFQPFGCNGCRALSEELTGWSTRLMLQGLQCRARGAIEPNARGFAAVLQAAKLEALAEFAAGAGHEINNPLATIHGRVQLLMERETDPERRQALRTIGGQAFRIRDMIGDMMLFARPPQPRPERLELLEVIPAALEPLHDDAAQCGGFLEFFAEDDSVPVWADRVQLAIVLANLVRNSLEALSAGGSSGSVRVQAWRTLESGRPVAAFSVSDSGPGLSETDWKHLFDPFYSGRSAGRGLGFGLPKCWRIVSRHGGRIVVRSVADQETTFTVFWPAEPPSADP